MAKTDPVQIVVEIVDSFSDDLQELRSQLEQLDRKNIDPDFDVDDDGDIESIRAQLEALRENIDADVDVDLEDIEQAEAMLDAVARDRTANIDVDTDDISLFDTPPAQLGPDELRGIGNLEDTMFKDEAFGRPELFEGAHQRLGIFDADFQEQLAQINTESVDRAVGQARGTGDFGGARRIMQGGGIADSFVAPRFPEGALPGDRLGGAPIPDDFAKGFDFNILPGLDEFNRGMGKADNNTSTLLDDLRDLMPSMRTWMNMVAAVIPMLISLAGAALGAAAAVGALGAGFAAIGGLGILGMGDSPQAAMQNFQKKMQEVGRQSFTALAPASNMMQPIMEDWMEGIPHQLSQLTDPLQGMVVFEDELEAIGGGFIDWIGDALRAMASLDDMVGSIAMNFGGAFGQFIIDALSAMVRDVYRNQDAYMNLASILVDFIIILFNVSKAVSFALAPFEPIVDFVAGLSNLFNNRFVVALLTAIGVILGLEAALTGVFLAFSLVTGAGRSFIGFLIGSWFPQITKAIAMTWQWVTAVSGLQAALRGLLAATGIGLLLVGAGLVVNEAMKGMGGPSGGGRAPTGNQITINGDVRSREMDRIKDIAGSEAQKEISFSSGY